MPLAPLRLLLMSSSKSSSEEPHTELLLWLLAAVLHGHQGSRGKGTFCVMLINS